MARPPKYASEDDKPVSVTLRLPRDLYDQAQQHAKRVRREETRRVPRHSLARDATDDGVLHSA